VSDAVFAVMSLGAAATAIAPRDGGAEESDEGAWTMTTIDLPTIRAALEEAYRENRALIAGLSDADLERPTPNPRWKVGQLVAHIAEDDAGTLYIGKLLAKGKNAKAPGFVVDLANWWGLRKHKRARAADLVAVLDRRHGELLAWLQTLTPEHLGRGGEVSGIGRVTLAEFLVGNRAHSREHGVEIRAALAGAAASGTGALNSGSGVRR
jgi:hypothetical protein